MKVRSFAVALLAAVVLSPARAAADSIGWPQPGGPGTPVVLTYSFSNLFDGGFNSQLTPAETRAAAAQAFAIWARYVPLHFHEVRDAGPPVTELEYTASGLPDIRIGYETTLPALAAAHAHLPFSTHWSGLAGDIHFSNDTSAFGTTSWGAAAQSSLELDFFSAVLHEIGHSLGLFHLADPTAVMGTVFLVFHDSRVADLRPADIAAIRALYGTGVGSVRTLDGGESTVPEPGTLILVASGIALLARRRLARR